MNEERHPNDLYETPIVAVHMLLGHHRFASGLWLDPSCGRGNLLVGLQQADLIWSGRDLHRATITTKRLGELGLTTLGTNITFGIDFLETTTLRGITNIIMNPPYSAADAHVRHALGMLTGPRQTLAVMLPWNWMTARKRTDLLPFLHKVVICGRLKMLPPGVEDKGHGGMRDFAWHVFRAEPTLSTTIVRA